MDDTGLIQRMRHAVAVEHRRLVLIGVLAAWTAGCTMPGPSSSEERSTRAASASFAVYALSRGRGVPDATRTAWHAVRTMLEDAQRAGKVVRLQQTRLGLEGEIRLCAEFADSKTAQEMLARAREIGKNVELLNVVEEPCPAQ